MSKEANMVEYEQGKLILESTDGTFKKSKDIKVSSELLDIISKTLQNKSSIKNEIESTGDITKTLWEVVITPELQDGIANGDFIRNECALEVRNAKTGKYVGKAKIKEAEILENKTINKTKTSPLSNITKSICSISGQLQMAEISQKLDIINSKLDSIRNEMWRERVSKLKATIEIVEEALELLPDDRAMDRVNACINPLKESSKFLESSIEAILSEKIPYSILNSFIEGLKFWELGRSNRAEYNNEYLNKIKQFLGEYGFLIELYSQAMGALGTCYQILYGYKKGQEYYNEMYDKVTYFSNELTNKLIYNLDIKGISIDKNIDISDIEKEIEKRQIPILKEIRANSIENDKISKMYNSLTNQINNSKILLTVNTEILLGVDKND